MATIPLLIKEDSSKSTNTGHDQLNKDSLIHSSKSIFEIRYQTRYIVKCANRQYILMSF